ncbi:hypothetical protein STPH1_7635 [Streptomyces sp. OM5714]|nr:hypothetical protein STPH1_7635 [Streptomyces sp. OM5714]
MSRFDGAHVPTNPPNPPVASGSRRDAPSRRGPRQRVQRRRGPRTFIRGHVQPSDVVSDTARSPGPRPHVTSTWGSASIVRLPRVGCRKSEKPQVSLTCEFLLIDRRKMAERPVFSEHRLPRTGEREVPRTGHHTYAEVRRPGARGPFARPLRNSCAPNG